MQEEQRIAELIDGAASSAERDDALADATTRRALAPQLRMDLLLQVGLRSDEHAQQRNWQAIRQAIAEGQTAPGASTSPDDGAAALPLANAASESQKVTSARWRSPWILLAAVLVVQAGIAGWWLWWPIGGSVPATVLVAGRPPQSTTVPRGRDLVTGPQEQVEFGLAAGDRLRLAPASRLRVAPQVDGEWFLRSGTLDGVVTTALQLRLPQGLSRASAARFQAQAGRWRSRLALEDGDLSVEPVDAESRALRPGGRIVWQADGRLRQADARRFDLLPLRISGPASGVEHDLMPRLRTAAGESGAGLVLPPRTERGISFMAPERYDLSAHLRRRSGEEALALVLPRMQGGPLVAILGGWRDTRQGFNLLGGEADRLNPTALWLPLFDQPGQVDYHLIARIRGAAVSIYLDGELLLDYHPGLELPASDSLAWPSVAPGRLQWSTHAASYELRDCRVFLQVPPEAVDMYGPQE